MGTTINLANIALGFDASKIQKGIDLSAGEIRKLNRIVQDSVSPVDRYNRELNILEKAHSTGALSAKRHAEAIEHLNQKYRQAPQQQTNPLTSDLKSTLAQYASLAVAFKGVQTSMSLAATAESNKISLEVLTGSAEKARLLFEGFIALDRSSPLSRQDFSRAAQTLIGYGLAAEQTMPALRALSEVSIGNADRFQSLSLAFGQVTANGRLMGQEVLQMVNAGFNPLQEISRTTGRSMLDLKKDMEAGAISATMVEDAFKSATSEGGRFFEMNEKLKNSAAGQYAKMKSDVELLATEIGTNLLPAAKALMEVMNAGADSNGKGGLLPSIATNFSSGIEGFTAILSDAFTNLDGDSYGTKFDEFLGRLGTQQGNDYYDSLRHVLTPEERLAKEKRMAAKADEERKELQRIANEEKAKQNALEFYEKEQKALQRQLDILQLGTAEVEFQENLKKGLSEDQARDIRNLQERLEAEKQITDDLEKRRKIDSETKDRIRNSEKDFDKLKSELKNDNPNNIAAAVAPTLRAGSVEAYRFLMNQRNEAAEIAQEQAEIAREQLIVQQQQLEAFQNSQMIGIAGRTA